MTKRVAVQRGLNEIKNELINQGYEVFDIEEGQNVDAVVYMADGYNIPNYNQFINMNAGADMGGDKGIILINAKGKGIEDIRYAIENRVYSKLFE